MSYNSKFLSIINRRIEANINSQLSKPQFGFTQLKTPLIYCFIRTDNTGNTSCMLSLYLLSKLQKEVKKLRIDTEVILQSETQTESFDKMLNFSLVNI